MFRPCCIVAQVWNTGCNLSIWFLVCFICFYKALRGVLGDDLVPTQFAHTFPFLLLLRVIYGFLVSDETADGADSSRQLHNYCRHSVY